MTVTPTISVFGILVRSGASASKVNLLTPTGTGPTRSESKTWSCSELSLVSPEYLDLSVASFLRGSRANVSQLPVEV